MSQAAEFWPSALDRVPVSYTALTVLPCKPVTWFPLTLPSRAPGTAHVRLRCASTWPPNW